MHCCRFAPWFVEPIIAGLEGKENKPFVYASDPLGAGVEAKEDGFVVSGTCANSMYGTCESLFKPDMVRRTCCVANDHGRVTESLVNVPVGTGRPV